MIFDWHSTCMLTVFCLFLPHGIFFYLKYIYNEILRYTSVRNIINILDAINAWFPAESTIFFWRLTLFLHSLFLPHGSFYLKLIYNEILRYTSIRNIINILDGIKTWFPAESTNFVED